jgi:hypothetical protein
MHLQEIAPIIEQIFKDNLKQRKYPFGNKITGIGNKIASGTLYNSVKVNVTQMQQNDASLEISFDAYGEFVSEGRLPNKRKVPISAIMQWLQEKGIGVRDERGRFVKGHSRTRKKIKNANQKGEALPIAYAIQTNIYKFGIRRTGWIENSYLQVVNSEKIMNLLGDDAMQDLLNILNENLKTY